MASQPLNTTISVFRTVRSFREDLRHESVKAITHKLRPLVMSVPNQEVRIEVKARDANTTDFSAFMGQGRTNGGTLGRGLPIVIGTRAAKDYGTVVNTLAAGINFPFAIGHDNFVENAAANLATNVLHADLRAVAPLASDT